MTNEATRRLLIDPGVYREVAQRGSPMLGRTVLYTLSEADVETIHHRRTTKEHMRKRMNVNPAQWPMGVQAHIGAVAKAGDILPMIVVRVWSSGGRVNGQVFLDGNDVLWVTDVIQGEDPGTYHY